ncbi:hypothetical protein ABIC33_001262 [Variovorax sp. 1140]|uniref:hypothetical protein n=1 Tax=Variovorax atrisoli TaxID=3394203 RepID=UPI003395A860
MAIDTSNLGMGGNPFLGADNPNLQSIIDLSSRDMVNNFNRTTQPAFNAAMVRSGSFGNSGIDAANLAAQGQLQTSLGDLASKLRFNDYSQQQGMYQWQKQFDQNGQQWQKQFDRSLYNDAYGQNQQNLQTGLSLLGMLGGLNGQDITNSTNYQNTPLNYLTQFSNLAGAMGRGGQTTNVTGNTGGGTNPITSAIGGAQLGNSFGKWLNGSGSGSGYSGTFVPSPVDSSYGGINYM